MGSEGRMTRTRIELLAPGGDLDAIKAAIAAGAGAVYCGLERFNARNRAANISLEQLGGILRLAHDNGCKVFLTLNIIMVESDVPQLVALLNRLVNTTVDGVIVQDLGLLWLLREHFPGLRVHASTQCTTHNQGQILFLAGLGVTRVNLSRELDAGEIGALAAAAHGEGVGVEVFVHGSYCISLSGICFMSSAMSGNSGNRGRCSQPCRDRYLPTEAGQAFPLNLKDNSAYFDLEQLAGLGVDALKIEGRMKGAHYVHTVVDTWRRQLDGFYEGQPVDDDSALHKVFNRDFSNGYLAGDLHRDMYSHGPRNRSADHLSKQTGQDPYAEIAAIRERVAGLIEPLSVEQAPLKITASGQDGAPLSLVVEGPGVSFDITSESRLVAWTEGARSRPLDREVLLQKLRAVEHTEYTIEALHLDGLQGELFLPFRELAAMARQVLTRLNGAAPMAPVELSLPPKRNVELPAPTLSVLIGSPDDLSLCRETTGKVRSDTHYMIPSSPGDGYEAVGRLLADNRDLTPWFPPVLLGADYEAAVEMLRRVRPRRVVSNNTGIAREAHQAEIPWVAGPQLNIANGFSLVCLKETLGCQGAFLSDELSVFQLRRIQPPKGFGLYYRIYHPLQLMTARQCLFHQVSGCEKQRIDHDCVPGCDRSATITSTRGEVFHVTKSPGQLCALHHGENFLNTGLLADLPGKFTGLLVDLRDIQTGTEVKVEKLELIRLFQDLLAGEEGAVEALHGAVGPTTDLQYRKGV